MFAHTDDNSSLFNHNERSGERENSPIGKVQADLSSPSCDFHVHQRWLKNRLSKSDQAFPFVPFPNHLRAPRFLEANI